MWSAGLWHHIVRYQITKELHYKVFVTPWKTVGIAYVCYGKSYTWQSRYHSKNKINILYIFHQKTQDSIQEMLAAGKYWNCKCTMPVNRNSIYQWYIYHMTITVRIPTRYITKMTQQSDRTWHRGFTPLTKHGGCDNLLGCNKMSLYLYKWIIAVNRHIICL